jgi:hypothetical protein
LEADVNSVKIDLKYPVEVGNDRIESMTMRGPKVRDLLASEKAARSDSEREVHLFACLCEVTPEIIENMAVGDYLVMQGKYKSFLS